MPMNVTAQSSMTGTGSGMKAADKSAASKSPAAPAAPPANQDVVPEQLMLSLVVGIVGLLQGLMQNMASGGTAATGGTAAAFPSTNAALGLTAAGTSPFGITPAASPLISSNQIQPGGPGFTGVSGLPPFLNSIFSFTAPTATPATGGFRSVQPVTAGPLDSPQKLQQEIQNFNLQNPGAGNTPTGLQALAQYLNQRFPESRFTPQQNGLFYPLNGKNFFVQGSGAVPPQAV
jgi:hypothetical protein